MLIARGYRSHEEKRLFRCPLNGQRLARTQDMRTLFSWRSGEQWFPEGSDDGAVLCLEGAEGTGIWRVASADASTSDCGCRDTPRLASC